MLQWIAFLAVVCALSVALNRRFERVLAPALCGLMVLLYVLAIPRVGEITVNMVFDPPWDRSRMSEAAMLAMGM